MKINNKPYIIAEAGVNHNGSLERAKELIREAKEAGCDAIKFQTYTADELVVKGTPKFWKSEGGDVEGTQYDAYAKLGGFPYEHYPELIEYAKALEIEFLSTPFSFEAATKLNDFGVSAFKIASSDMSTLPFLTHVAKFGKPIILSTGASTLEEVKEAVRTIEDAGNHQIIILQCTLQYPSKITEMNLAVIHTLKKEFPFYTIGLSDHSLGENTSGYAVAAGAMVLEKHFTVDKTLPDSADHWLSLNPLEMKTYVDEAHYAFEFMGDAEKKVFPYEEETRKYDKRSIVAKVFIPKGTKVTEDMITYKRPGTGIWPKDKDKVIGSWFEVDIPQDTIFQWVDLKNNG